MESTISAAPQISIDREKTLRSHRRYWVLRRAQDIVFSLLALILLAPMALLISLAIVLDSPGDGAIFRQRRVGRDGKLFWLYKFRTMCPDAEEQLNELLSQNQMDGPVFKIKGDPRITRVGRFLRKTSLDELPQLLNVLRGDMSIVGPRPALPRAADRTVHPEPRNHRRRADRAAHHQHRLCHLGSLHHRLRCTGGAGQGRRIAGHRPVPVRHFHHAAGCAAV